MACSTKTLGSILVLGSGITALAVAKRALNLVGGPVESVTLYDSRPFADLPQRTRDELDSLTPHGLIVRTGEDLASNVSGGAAFHYDLCIASPGISMFSDLFVAAQAVSNEVISEPEFAYRLSPNNWIAITGTNGKTTTTALLTHILNAAGGRAVSVGNIGTPTIEGVCHRRQEGLDDDEFLVAELSSYQLASTARFHPCAAILLNITPDHIDWHKTHEHYRDSKLRVFENMGRDDVAVLNIDDPEVAQVASGFPRGDLLPASSYDFTLMCVSLGGAVEVNDRVTQNGGMLVDGFLTVYLDGAMHRLCAVEDLRIKGDHNVGNALCAACVAIALGFEDDLVSEALMTFEAIEHRLQFVAEVDGVSYYNDSKATNPDAVLKALTAFGDRPLTLMMGGYDKGTALDELVVAVAARCDRVVLFGAAASRFAEAFDNAPAGTSLEVSVAPTMLEALEVARSSAGEGSAVVLSPACASFDEFDSYGHRGDVFMRAVNEMDSSRG